MKTYTQTEKEELLQQVSSIHSGLSGFTKIDTFKFAAEVNDIVRPKNILEIGFYAGHSSLAWLIETDANVTSVDSMSLDVSLKEIEPIFLLLFKQFPNRFSFIYGSSFHPETYEMLCTLQNKRPFDLIFIDGDHRSDTVFNDIILSWNLGIPWIVFDDYSQDDFNKKRGMVKTGIVHFLHRFPNIIRFVKYWNCSMGKGTNPAEYALYRNHSIRL